MKDLRKNDKLLQNIAESEILLYNEITYEILKIQKGVTLWELVQLVQAIVILFRFQM